MSKEEKKEWEAFDEEERKQAIKDWQQWQKNQQGRVSALNPPVPPIPDVGVYPRGPFEGSLDANRQWWWMLHINDLSTGRYPLQSVYTTHESEWRRCKKCGRVQHLKQHGRECNRCGEILED